MKTIPHRRSYAVAIALLLVCVAPLVLRRSAARVAEATSGGLGLRIERQSVLRDGETIFRAAAPAAVRPGADIRRAHALVESPDGDAGVLLLGVGRAEVAVPVRRGDDGRLEFGRGFEVPWATEAFFAPAGDRFLLVSEEDLYLPESSGFLGNRGAVCLSLADVEWRPTLDAALARPRANSWYGEADRRFVPRGEFEVERVFWPAGGAALDIRDADGERRTIRLRPLGDWRAAARARAAIENALEASETRLVPVGDGLVLAFPDDGPSVGFVALFDRRSPSRAVARFDTSGPRAYFGAHLDLEADGNPEVAVYTFTGIQWHKLCFVLRVSRDGLAPVGESLFTDEIPVERRHPGQPGSRVVTAACTLACSGTDWGELVEEHALRAGALTRVRRYRRLPAALWSDEKRVREEFRAVGRDLPALWRNATGIPLKDADAILAWWRAHREEHRRGEWFVFE